MTAIQTIKQQTEQLRTEVSNVIMFLSNKQGALVSIDTSSESPDLASIDLETPAEALTTTLLNHQDVAEALYDVLYRYRRLVKGSDPLIERLNSAFTPYALRNRISRQSGKRQRSFDASKDMDDVLAAATARIRLSFSRAGSIDAEDTLSHGGDAKDSNQAFSDIVVATIVTLCKAQSALSLLKLFMNRFGGYTTVGAKLASSEPVIAPGKVLSPQGLFMPIAVGGQRLPVTLKSIRSSLPADGGQKRDDGFRREFFNLTGMKLADGYRPSNGGIVARPGSDCSVTLSRPAISLGSTLNGAVALPPSHGQSSSYCATNAIGRKVSFARDVELRQRRKSLLNPSASTFKYPMTPYPEKNCNDKRAEAVYTVRDGVNSQRNGDCELCGYGDFCFCKHLRH